MVSVAVFGVDQLSGKFPVDVDGTLSFPLLGPIPAAGLTARELETEIAAHLKARGFFTTVPQITVDLQQTPNRRVTVTGAVRTPGIIQYAGEITLLDALVRAGNASGEAGDDVIVVRSSSVAGSASEVPSEVATVSLSGLQGTDVAAHNVTLQDGDLVIVQKALSVFISGYVRSPGAYRVERGTTVLQALALAGGLSERGTNRGLRILRNKEELDDVTLETIVEPGDTVVVRASPW